MISPIPPLETLLFGIEDETTLEALVQQAWLGLDEGEDIERTSFGLGYRAGLLAALGAFRERLVYSSSFASSATTQDY